MRIVDEEIRDRSSIGNECSSNSRPINHVLPILPRASAVTRNSRIACRASQRIAADLREGEGGADEGREPNCCRREAHSVV